MDPRMRMLARRPWLRFFTDPGDGGAGGGGGTGPAAGTGESGGNSNGAGEGDGAFRDPETGETYNFPDKTPLAEMTPQQVAEYWRHKARKHENAVKARSDYDQVKVDAEKWRQAQRDNLPADQRAIEEARNQAAEQVRQEERQKFGARLVQAEIRGALRARNVEDARIDAVLGPLDHTYFLTPEGEVDTDKVTNYAAGFGQGGTGWPDTGQGRRGDDTPAKGVAAGRDLFRDRKKK